MNIWSKIQQHHLLCSLSHGFVGAIIAILIFDPLNLLSLITGLAGAFVVFSWFTIYECMQWITTGDCPSQELGEAMIGFVGMLAIISL